MDRRARDFEDKPHDPEPDQEGPHFACARMMSGGQPTIARMRKEDQESVDLNAIAHQVMIERGLEPNFPPEVERELKHMTASAHPDGADVRDLRQRLWNSIDNDDSRDLDQLTLSEPQPNGATTIFVAVADVDALVKKGSAIDLHAQHNTTSVYTGVKIFPMLPEKLSTDLTSLNPGQDRMAVVTEMTVSADGSLIASELYRAYVHNHAKLTYKAVGAWLEGEGPLPEAAGRIKGMEQQLRVQDQVAQRLKRLRHEQGALDLETIEARAVVKDGKVIDLDVQRQNRAMELIEDFMVAVNGVTARYLQRKKFASFRRVVRSPERWERIMTIAEQLGERLPAQPDAPALEEFLLRRKAADPLRFPDLSLSIVKLMGSGEYVVEKPGHPPIGHFGLAVRDYAHSTAPNRRYPDLVTQRLLKAAIAGHRSAYTVKELEFLAVHCTAQEDASNKVERQVAKVEAALLLAPRIGERFDALVTGASTKGTWVRVLHPAVEGKVIRGEKGLDVGDRIKVKLVSVNVERGFIDFERVH